MKICTSCRVEKGLECFSRRYAGKDIWQSLCRMCDSARVRAYSAANPEKEKARKAAYRATNPEKVRASNVSYRAANSEKEKERCTAYRVANRDKARAYSSAHYAANSERLNASKALYYAANKEKFRAYYVNCMASNPEKVQKRKAAWHKANLDKARISHQTRRARATGGKLSMGIAKKLYELQKGKCPCCKLNLGKDYHLDHIMPLALGGSNTDENIQLLRRKCNLQKGAKHPAVFMRQRGLLI